MVFDRLLTFAGDWLKRLTTLLLSGSEEAARRFFWLAFVLFLAARIALVAIPISQRAEPIEADDSYRYMAQARVMQECLASNCPALESLEAQIERGSTSEANAFQQQRVRMHLFTYFHPLYSVTLSALQSAGIDLIAAYTLLYLGMGIFICAAIAFWVRALFRHIGGGLTLLLIAFTIFPGPGLHVFTPSNMAMGFAIVSWVLIIQGGRRRHWLLPFLWIAAVGFHSIGILYVGAAAVLLLLTASWPIEKRTGWLLGAALGIIFLRYALIFWVPEFSLGGDIQRYYGSSYALTQAVPSGIGTLVDLGTEWAHSLGGITAAGLFITLGLLTTGSEERKKTWISGIGLASLLAASTLYFHPIHGNTATPRAWLPAAIFLMGLVSTFLRAWLGVLLNRLRRPTREKLKVLTDEKTLLSAEGWLLAGLFLTVVILAQSFATYFGRSVRNYPSTLNTSTTRQDLTLPRVGETGYFSFFEPDSALLFMHEIPLYHALANGLLWNEVVFYPAIANSEVEEIWIEENEGLSHVVAITPLAGLPEYTQGGLLLQPGGNLLFSGQMPFDAAETLIWIENRGPATKLYIDVGNGDGASRAEMLVEADMNSWVRLSLSSGTIADRLALRVEEGQLLIKGMRLEEDAATLWPWDKGISVISGQDPEAMPADLSSDQLQAQLGLNLHILLDDTSLVLAKIE